MGVTTHPSFAPPIEILDFHARLAESESTGSYEYRLLLLWGPTGFVSNRKVVGRAFALASFVNSRRRSVLDLYLV